VDDGKQLAVAQMTPTTVERAAAREEREVLVRLEGIEPPTLRFEV
jgi:hypothetical protein